MSAPAGGGTTVGPDALVAGRYRLVERIGGGGMGAVWRALDELLGREVAVKEVYLSPTGDPDEAERQRAFALREGRIAARLTHPHAIAVYDAAIDGGRPWLVMEHLPSCSLAQVLTQQGVLPVAQVAQIGAQLADALAAAHAAGVVHRDVKPGNVLVGQGERHTGVVKITDFGISRVRGDVALTQTGIVKGTPAFLAPEVARGQEPDEPSDVYSLGATLYTCLEGTPPFGMADNPLEQLHKVAGGEMTPPRHAGALTAPLLAMLATDPAQRPTMVQVRDQLATLAAGRDRTITAVLTARTPLRPVPPAATLTETPAAAPESAPEPAPQPRPQPPSLPEPERQPEPVAAAAPPEHPVERPAERTPPPPVAPVREGTDGRRGRRAPLLVAAVLAVLLLAGGGTWLALGQRDGSAGGTAAGTPTSADPSSSPAPTTSAAPPSSTQQSSAAPSSASSSSSSSEASSQPSSSAPPPAADPATAVRQTLDRYYALLPGDPEAAYAMTGPTLRSRASASYYRDFWKPWTEVSLVDVSDVADQGGGTYTATTQVRFTKADGSGHTELHSVRFVRGGDGGLLVDLDEFVRTL